LRVDADVIRPAVAAHGCVVTASIIATVDQEAANASGAHLCEGDLLVRAGEGRHAPLKRGLNWQAINLRANTRDHALRVFFLRNDKNRDPHLSSASSECET
jgi:hypothetical protein